jgi:hypothetical protein
VTAVALFSEYPYCAFAYSEWFNYRYSVISKKGANKLYDCTENNHIQLRGEIATFYEVLN